MMMKREQEVTRMVDGDEFYPELSGGPDRVFPINESARKDMKFFDRKKLQLIVFYGNIGSAINRSDVGSLRYVCGTKQYVMGKLSEMEFKTWMDYRAYVFIVNQDRTFGRIGGRFEFDVEDVLKMASYVRSRKRLVEAMKNAKRARVSLKESETAAVRKERRRRIDIRVRMSMKALGMG